MTATKVKKRGGKKGAAKGVKSKAKMNKSKGDERTGHAPQSQLDLDETRKLEAARAKKAKAKLAAEGKPKQPKPRQAKTKKLSALDAAAKVLASAKTPMSCKELIAAMAEQNLWTSPGGATPWATLYSALLREIDKKGKEARFKKVERGRFAANG